MMTDKSFKNNWSAMSDQGLMEHIGAFIKFHRLQQNKSQDELAEVAGMSRSTLSLLERGQTVTLSTLIQVLRVLDLLYIMDNFQVNTQISPIQLAKLAKEERQRASKGKDKDKHKSDW